MDSSYERLRHCDANRKLVEILRWLVRPSVEIEEWLDKHGQQRGCQECECEWCAREGGAYADLVEENLVGLKWAIAAAAAGIEGCILPVCLPEDGPTKEGEAAGPALTTEDPPPTDDDDMPEAIKRRLA